MLRRTMYTPVAHSTQFGGRLQTLATNVQNAICMIAFGLEEVAKGRNGKSLLFYCFAVSVVKATTINENN